MADNVAITAGAGTSIATDDVGGIQYQRVKVAVGADGTAVDQLVATSGIPKVGDTDSLGQAQYNFPAGFVRVTDEPHQLFYDPFDGAVVDVTNRWTAAFGLGLAVTPSQTAGQLTVNAGATSTGWATLTANVSLVPTVPAWLGVSFAINLTDGAALVSTGYRFWGVATNPGAPSVAAPLTDAVGFEISGGKMFAVVYTAGVRTSIQDMSAATGNASAPTDALNHRYIVYIRTDKAYWYVDALTTPVATSSFQSPAVQTLPIKYLAVSGGSATTINSPGVAAWDTGKNNTQLSDGQFAWRKATVKAASTAVAATDLPLAVGLHPTSPLPTGTNQIGTTLGPTLTKGTQGSTGYSVQDLKDSGRNVTNYFMPAQIITTAAEVMMTLTGYKSGAAVAGTATPAVVTAAKTYRITSVVLTYVATTTAGTAQFRLRANTGGAGVVGSPLVTTWQIGAAAAVAGVTQSLHIDIPDGLEFAAGTGIAVGMIGFGATGTAAIVGYGMIALHGFEY